MKYIVLVRRNDTKDFIGYAVFDSGESEIISPVFCLESDAQDYLDNEVS